MSETTLNLKLPMLAAAQAQKHVTHNDALAVLDALIHLSVSSKSEVNPPVAPNDGSRHIVPEGGTGAWAGNGGCVACWHSGDWRFHAPRTGWLAWVEDEGKFVAWQENGWMDLPGAFDQLGVNATPGEDNRLAVGGVASLFDGEDAGHNLKVNKGAAGETASIIFQTGYSGRAELGLLGSDDFTIKVSDSGATWLPVVSVNVTNGKVGLGRTPGAGQLDVEGGIRSLSGAAPFLQLINNGPNGTQAWIGIPDWNRSAFYIYGAQADIMSVFDTPTRSHRLFAGGSERIRIASGGEVGVGTANPTARLHVAGPVRMATYLKAALPSAASVGAGTLAYVSDAAGGAQFAYSDGAQWLKMRDGNPV
ncbi:DUF2793 domain-containing protein [Stappia sp. WLB 29]|uniref:DUF2793 domain-containing protein n=1 Tax=Stappia sp. WLB 29 TaxID=2925220 RepID=UPI0020C08776|nr:DUF2793 domain-containing protein [Stappia sp. WLB 29]